MPAGIIVGIVVAVFLVFLAFCAFLLLAPDSWLIKLKLRKAIEPAQSSYAMS